MIPIKGKSYSELTRLIGSRVRFVSDCELFPGFDVTVRVVDVTISGSEILFITKRTDGKKTTIGSNMKNLQYEVL